MFTRTPLLHVINAVLTLYTATTVFRRPASATCGLSTFLFGHCLAVVVGHGEHASSQAPQAQCGHVDIDARNLTSSSASMTRR